MSELDRLKLENKFKDLEENLVQLLSKHNSLKIKNQELGEEVSELKFIISNLSSKVKELSEKNKNLKLVNALQGNDEHKQLMKIRLNKLIHEVDICMKQVTGL